MREGKPVTPAFLFAALLWQPLQQKAALLTGRGESAHNAIMSASEDVIAAQAQSTAIPRRFSAVTRQIWLLQLRLERTKGKRWKRLLYDQRFRAAYDFLLLRAVEEPELQPLCDFWTEAQKDVELPQRPARGAATDRQSRRDRPRRRRRRARTG